MKYFTNCAPFVLLFSLAACAGETLDGGSNTSGSSSGSSGDPSASSGTSGTPAPVDKPVEGVIAGKPFTPLSVELQFSKTNKQWFLSLRNYGVDCGVVDMKSEVAAEDKLIVTVGKVDAAAGTFPIDYADGHGATFQVGVFEANGPKSVSEPAKKGSLRLDAWSETAGSTVTGHLELSNDESSVKGTFTAKVCEAR